MRHSSFHPAAQGTENLLYRWKTSSHCLFLRWKTRVRMNNGLEPLWRVSWSEHARTEKRGMRHTLLGCRGATPTLSVHGANEVTQTLRGPSSPNCQVLGDISFLSIKRPCPFLSTNMEFAYQIVMILTPSHASILYAQAMGLLCVLLSNISQCL